MPIEPDRDMGLLIDRSPDGLRTGVAKIVTNNGSGAYTITEQWRTTGGANQNAVSPPGRVSISARDISASTAGAVNDIVQFWESRKLDDSVETLISVSTSQVGGGGVFVISHSILIESGAVDATYEISPLDLSGKLLVHESRALTNTALGANHWEAGSRVEGTFDVPASPAMDYILNDFDTTSYSLEVDATGVLQWDWQEQAYARYAQCIVYVYNSFPDTTVSAP